MSYLDGLLRSTFTVTGTKLTDATSYRYSLIKMAGAGVTMVPDIPNDTLNIAFDLGTLSGNAGKVLKTTADVQWYAPVDRPKVQVISYAGSLTTSATTANQSLANSYGSLVPGDIFPAIGANGAIYQASAIVTGLRTSGNLCTRRISRTFTFNGSSATPLGTTSDDGNVTAGDGGGTAILVADPSYSFPMVQVTPANAGSTVWTAVLQVTITNS